MMIGIQNKSVDGEVSQHEGECRMEIAGDMISFRIGCKGEKAIAGFRGTFMISMRELLARLMKDSYADPIPPVPRRIGVSTLGIVTGDTKEKIVANPDDTDSWKRDVDV